MENNQVLQLKKSNNIALPSDQSLFTDWNWMIEQGHIRSCMEKFKHSHLYRVTPSEVVNSINRSGFALGGTRKDDSGFAGINNASSPAPFTLMLHNLLEAKKRVPLWEDFRNRIISKPEIYLDFVCLNEKVNLSDFNGDWLDNPAARAVRYRLATAYNSWIRELHLFATLRHDYNLPVRHHFMLDILWKQDIVCENKVIELYVDSPYKTSYSGRKIKASEASPLRTIIPHGMKVRNDRSSYNKPWLVRNDDIVVIAGKLSSPENFMKAG